MPGKTREVVFILGQFHLEHPLAGVSMLRKDVQNQRGPVEHPNMTPKNLLQFAKMPGRKLIVEDHDIGQRFFHEGFQLFDFSSADKCFRIGVFQFLG